MYKKNMHEKMMKDNWKQKLISTEVTCLPDAESLPDADAWCEDDEGQLKMAIDSHKSHMIRLVYARDCWGNWLVAELRQLDRNWVSYDSW